jgi:aldehyde dehydrogenase (NAD+)
VRTSVDSLFIGGSWVSPSTRSMIPVRSASTGELIGSVAAASSADVDKAVEAARRAFDDPTGWSSWAPERRAEALERFAVALEARAEATAGAVSAQNGMPITVSTQVEARFPAVMVRYYADLITGEPTETTQPGLLGGTTHIRMAPAGVVAAISPWNFPQALAAQKYAPALAAGCTVVLKPSPETSLDTQFVAEAALEARLPDGVLNVVPAERDVSAYLVGHPGVDKVAFTGSTAAGRRIGEVCGRLLRPVTLELGGRSAAVILDDADLDLGRVGQAMFGAMLINNGQTCFLSTRILAPRSRYAEVVDAISALAGSLTVGDALDPATRIGPLVTRAHRALIESQVAKGIAEGARLVAGGRRPNGLDAGWFLEPTVLADVDHDWQVAREEIFGPVLTITPYTDEEQAVQFANDSEYGLAGTVWTSSPERGLSVARRIRTGSVGINGYLPDLGAPFGGVKASGVGRELGRPGLAAYQTSQSLYEL